MPSKGQVVADQRDEAGVLRQLKEDGGFWLPNSFVDCHAQLLKARGVYLYVLLARSVTRSHYPSADDLAALAKMSRSQVDSLLGFMVRSELLNTSDLKAIYRESN